MSDVREVVLADEAQTLAAGRRLGVALRTGDVLALSGPLGAGKTTLVRGLLAGLGWTGEVPSPTFALVQPYEPSAVRLPLWHVDLYRLDSAEEAKELGLDEVLADGALAIEWPERLGDRLWPQALRIAIAPEGDGRRLTLCGGAAWAERWPFR